MDVKEKLRGQLPIPTKKINWSDYTKISGSRLRDTSIGLTVQAHLGLTHRFKSALKHQHWAILISHLLTCHLVMLKL
jgi:hypothetical protein